MRTISLVLLIVFFCINFLNAQDAIGKKKIYRTWVSLNEYPFKVKGVLYEINDTSILVSGSLVIKEYETNKPEVVELYDHNIETIKTRQYNNVARGIFKGTIIGFGIGGMIGLISGDDPPNVLWPWTAGEKAIIYGGSLAVCGACIGGGLGLIKVKIPINRSAETFNENINKLKSYSYTK